MGATGTGKTNFIVKARKVLCPDSPASEGPASGESLKGGTKDISAYRILNHPDYGNRVVLLDTPGFDDSIQDDGRILEKIGDWIKHTYRDHCGVTLAGILYFNRMSDNRANGTALRNLKLLGNLCGTHAAANVVFVTTMWDTMMKTPEGGNKAKERLEEYSKKWWKVNISPH
ncbi:hypothetical protein BJ165DRAFT_297861 [Panaeolus papilionaceus]|nr:hypothetical protein BJ165DRAFT_297861 [Panaeolus papilionaceus]